MSEETPAQKWANAIFEADRLEGVLTDNFCRLMGLPLDGQNWPWVFDGVSIDPLDWDGISFEIHGIHLMPEWPKAQIQKWLTANGFDAFRAQGEDGHWVYILTSEAEARCNAHHSGPKGAERE